MKTYLSSEYLYGLINRERSLPREMASAQIDRKDSVGNITYCRWDMEFRQEVDVGKLEDTGIDEVQIIFNLNRDIEWSIDRVPDGSEREIVRMAPGEVCVYRNENRNTHMHYDNGVPFRFKSLQMKTERFRELLGQVFPADEVDDVEKLVSTGVRKTRMTPEMYRILSEIDCADRYREFGGLFLEAKMTELTTVVLFGIIHEGKESERQRRLDPVDVKAIERLREQIQLEPYQNYDAQEVASELSMSVSKLNRLFRAHYGTSMHSYVQEMRLDYAAELLNDGKANVTGAALRAGYGNMSYFSKSFRRRFGVTPSEFAERKVSESDS